MSQTKPSQFYSAIDRVFDAYLQNKESITFAITKKDIEHLSKNDWLAILDYATSKHVPILIVPDDTRLPGQ